jgi:uncharacterized membrane protein YbaN (DUF454 family)
VGVIWFVGLFEHLLATSKFLLQFGDTFVVQSAKRLLLVLVDEKKKHPQYEDWYNKNSFHACMEMACHVQPISKTTAQQ